MSEYRHGDLFECKDGYWEFIVINKEGEGRGFDDIMTCLRFANEINTAINQIEQNNLGEFIYNVFDKESADSDCDTRCMDIKNKILNQEAIMPIKIETPTMLNEKNIEDYNNEAIGKILVVAVGEAKAAEALAKETKSTTLKSDAAKIRKDIAALTKLLDARTES